MYAAFSGPAASIFYEDRDEYSDEYLYPLYIQLFPHKKQKFVSQSCVEYSMWHTA
jgi:hypothetical protein